MFGYVLAFILGCVTSACVAYWNRKCVDRATREIRSKYESENNNLRKSNAKLLADMDSLQRSSECTDAYRRGVQKGRRDPLTQAEKLVDSFGGRNVQIRSLKTS